MPPRLPQSPQSAVPESASYLDRLNLDKHPELIAPAAVAELLGVCRQTVYHLVATGELQAIQINRRAMRVFRESLRDYLRRKLV